MTLGLVTATALLAGCASNRRLATMDERASMQAVLQQYVQESRLTGEVVLNEVVHVKDGTANVGYKLHAPTIQLYPLYMHAKMERSDTGWWVVSNTADPTIHDCSAWPMVRPPPQ